MNLKFHIRTNKKGASLIYVVIASAVLLILSGVIAVTAMRNMDLTMNSSFSRSAYISDKSAIEFAKGILEQQYEAGSFKNFAVTDGGNPYGWKYNSYGSYKVNGENCFATCDITPDANDSNKYTAAITAGYPSSETNKKKLLKMKYTTACTFGGGGGFPYIQCGLKYGTHALILENPQIPTILENVGGHGVSIYPLVFNLPVRITNGTSNGILQAPQIFFLGGHIDDSTSFNINGKGQNFLCNAAIYAYSSETSTIKSDFIYIASDRINVKEGGGSYALNISPLNKSTGYIYFANENGCNVYKTAQSQGMLDGSEKVIHFYKKGLYFYSLKVNLFSHSCALMKVADNDVKNILDENNVDYVENERNGPTFATAEGNSAFQPNGDCKADWTDNGKVKGCNGMGENSHVFFYATNAEAWKNNTLGYSAKEISFMYVNNDPTIIIGSTNGSTHTITFNADAVFFCGQKQDGSGNSSDGLTLKQGDSSGKFILNSSKGKGSVTLTVYHKLAVIKKGSSGYTLSAGTYTVATGTDLFGSNTTIGSFTLESGGGSGGSSGGGFSGGKYSW